MTIEERLEVLEKFREDALEVFDRALAVLQSIEVAMQELRSQIPDQPQPTPVPVRHIATIR